jgi:hypothetical protein
VCPDEHSNHYRVGKYPDSPYVVWATNIAESKDSSKLQVLLEQISKKIKGAALKSEEDPIYNLSNEPAIFDTLYVLTDTKFIRRLNPIKDNLTLI